MRGRNPGGLIRAAHFGKLRHLYKNRLSGVARPTSRGEREREREREREFIACATLSTRPAYTRTCTRVLAFVVVTDTFEMGLAVSLSASRSSRLYAYVYNISAPLEGPIEVATTRQTAYVRAREGEESGDFRLLTRV